MERLDETFGNRWFRTDALGDIAPHTGVRSVLLTGSTEPSHAVDVTDHLQTGIASLRAHVTHVRGPHVRPPPARRRAGTRRRRAPLHPRPSTTPTEKRDP